MRDVDDVDDVSGGGVFVRLGPGYVRLEDISAVAPADDAHTMLVLSCGVRVCLPVPCDDVAQVIMEAQDGIECGLDCVGWAKLGGNDCPLTVNAGDPETGDAPLADRLLNAHNVIVNLQSFVGEARKRLEAGMGKDDLAATAEDLRETMMIVGATCDGVQDALLGKPGTVGPDGRDVDDAEGKFVPASTTSTVCPCAGDPHGILDAAPPPSDGSRPGEIIGQIGPTGAAAAAPLPSMPAPGTAEPINMLTIHLTIPHQGELPEAFVQAMQKELVDCVARVRAFYGVPPPVA